MPCCKELLDHIRPTGVSSGRIVDRVAKQWPDGAPLIRKDVRTTIVEGRPQVDFVAIDIETANPNMASICQIGIASFRNAELDSEWVSLVNPEDWFFPGNVGVHGITEEMVEGAPTIRQLESRLRKLVEGKVVVSHTPFDRLALHQAFEAYGLPPPRVTWLDSARVARRTWEEVSRRGYGLANVCRLIGHQFTHHNALEDAKAAGQILLAAMERTGLSIVDWLSRVEQPIIPSTSTSKQTHNSWRQSQWGLVR